MEKYYILVDNEKKGPYALSQLRDMWKSGAITMDAQYASESMSNWADIGELMDSEASTHSTENKVADEIAAQQIRRNISKLAHVELKDCPACGEPVSRDAATCPSCGCNFYQRYFRIFLTIILPSIFGVLLIIWGIMKLSEAGYVGEFFSVGFWVATCGGVAAALNYGIPEISKLYNNQVDAKTRKLRILILGIGLALAFSVFILYFLFFEVDTVEVPAIKLKPAVPVPYNEESIPNP